MEKHNDINWEQSGLLEGLKTIRDRNIVKRYFQAIKVNNIGEAFTGFNYLLFPAIRRSLGLILDGDNQNYLIKGEIRGITQDKILSIFDVDELAIKLEKFIDIVLPILKNEVLFLDYEVVGLGIFCDNYVAELCEKVIE